MRKVNGDEKSIKVSLSAKRKRTEKNVENQQQC